MTAAWPSGRLDAITDVPGIRVGHWTSRRAATGCTVLLCEGATGAAVDVRGGAPGTRETELLAGANLVRRCDAVVFSGGSAFGLAAATGVMRWCAEHEIGFKTTGGLVPIVPGAVIYDLPVGKHAWPTEAEGYRAAAAARGGRVARGSVGAGTGATVAKLLGAAGAVKGGLGTASVTAPDGLVVGALVVLNAVGHIVDPATGREVAASRTAEGGTASLEAALSARRDALQPSVENTTLVCIATNASADHRLLQRLTYHAHDGLARAIVPVHTLADGDTAFALAMGDPAGEPPDGILLGALVVRAVERAVLDAVRSATPLAGIPAARGVNESGG